MNTALIYFTGTGNSLAVTRLLASKLFRTTILSAKEMLDQSRLTLNVDACGFVFPVYCQDAPEMMKRLVKQVQLSPLTYVFAIATNNGDVGYSHYSINRLLRKKGLSLNAGFAVLMPGNSIAPRDSTNPEEETQRRLKASAAAVYAIADAVNKKMALPYAGTDSLRKHAKGLRNMFRHKVIYKVPEKFWATDACNQCGICSRICPEHNITTNAGLPVWGRKCQMCLACIHWCPVAAVQNGQGTLHGRRYHHPDITASDLMHGVDMEAVGYPATGAS